ncbi:MAG TPA: 5-formyltetrahydrofolate cyclo-ligase [Roseiarcus sp.]|nr:5-formyltetrahydrofolate cyclo-ligase [Roseiarcus sp.]
MTTAFAAAKNDLRQAALARRMSISAAMREKFSIRLAKEGVVLAGRFAARAVSAFFSLRDEPDTLPLLRALAEAGFPTLLPVTGPRGAPLVFRLWRPGDPLKTGAMKISEPLASAPTLDPDLLFTPLACFDRRGRRIGYGAGYYDLTLQALRAKGRAIAVGVAYGVAEGADLPDEPHDQRLDFVLTETELIDCADGG